MVNVKLVAIFGIIIISAAAGIAWPFLSNIKPVFFVPVQTSKWYMGKGSEYNPELLYQISVNKTKFSTDLKFLPNHGENNLLSIKIMPSNGSRELNQTFKIGLVYDFTETSIDSKPYVDLLDQTIFSMRDYATVDQYLTKDAEWGDLYIGENHETLKITDSGKMSFAYGSSNAFLLSYRIGAKINKIWIVDNIPLPVKAEIYDPEGNLQYAYELISLKAPLTPSLIS